MATNYTPNRSYLPHQYFFLSKTKYKSSSGKVAQTAIKQSSNNKLQVRYLYIEHTSVVFLGKHFSSTFQLKAVQLSD